MDYLYLLKEGDEEGGEDSDGAGEQNPLHLGYWSTYSWCTKYSTRTKYSASAYHLCYNAKKPPFGEFIFGKIKKEEFERRILKKKSVFSPLKLLNKHFSNMIYFSLIQILPVVYCGGGEISPTLKPNSGSCLESQPMFPFPWGVMGKIF